MIMQNPRDAGCGSESDRKAIKQRAEKDRNSINKSRKLPPERIETDFGYIQIEDTTSRGEPVRLYRHNGAFSSGTFLRREKKYDIVFDYPKRFEEAFRFIRVHRALMIGGAAYQYPKYFISHHAGSMDVVEIDPMAERIARKWFYLDDLFEEFQLEESGRLNCITADARDYLAGADQKYDVIFNDAFSGASPVMKLATLEATAKIKEHLTEGGIYMSNVIGTVYGEGSDFLKSLLATAQKVFLHVHVLYTNPEDRDGMTKGNYMLMATDLDIAPEGKIRYHVSRFDTVLRDPEA